MTFKDRQRKTQRIALKVTVDKSHREHMNRFDKLVNHDRYDYRNKHIVAVKELSRFEDRLHRGDIITEKDAAHMSRLRDQIEEYKTLIARIDDGTDELDYFEKNGDTLMAYYDVTKDEMAGHWNHGMNEEFDDLDRLNAHMQTTKCKKPTIRKVKTVKSASSDIRNFFAKQTTKPAIASATTETNDDDTCIDSDSDEITKGVISGNELRFNKEDLADDYFTHTDPGYQSKMFRTPARKLCTSADCMAAPQQNEMVLDNARSLYYCRDCGDTEHAVMDNERPSYKEPMSDQTMSPYKRINHQPGWLRVDIALLPTACAIITSDAVPSIYIGLTVDHQ